MLVRRVYGLAPSYEDVNDCERLREDAVFALLAGRREAGRVTLAGKSTLNRLEPGAGQAAMIRLRLLKIGVRIRVTARCILVSISEGCALMDEFPQAWAQMRC